MIHKENLRIDLHGARRQTLPDQELDLCLSLPPAQSVLFVSSSLPPCPASHKVSGYLWRLLGRLGGAAQHHGTHRVHSQSRALCVRVCVCARAVFFSARTHANTFVDAWMLALRRSSMYVLV